MPPVNSPITENVTVMHILKMSQEVTETIGQHYTLVTFDLAAAKKAYAILWTYPDHFANVIIRLGAFHMACAYIGALGALMKGSGFEEVIVESAVCASGLVEKVMSGKHYNRARFVIRKCLEALERLLWESFENDSNCFDDTTLQLLQQLAKEPTSSNLSAVKMDPKCIHLMDEYQEYKSKIHAGEKGKTAQFWLGFIDKAWLLMRFLHATKVNDVELHIACLHDMCPLFFSQNRPNYA